MESCWVFKLLFGVAPRIAVDSQCKMKSVVFLYFFLFNIIFFGYFFLILPVICILLFLILCFYGFSLCMDVSFSVCFLYLLFLILFFCYICLFIFWMERERRLGSDRRKDGEDLEGDWEEKSWSEYIIWKIYFQLKEKKASDNRCWQGCGEKPLYTAGGREN